MKTVEDQLTECWSEINKLRAALLEMRQSAETIAALMGRLLEKETRSATC